jgi:hypothetical protein
MRKFVCALVVTVCAISVAMGDEIIGRITKIDGNDVTVVQKKKGEEAKTFKLKLTADTKIVKGKFDPDTKKIIAGDAIDGGKTALTKMLDKAGEKGIAAQIVTTGEVKDGATVTEIRITGKKGKKKKDAN